MATVSSVGWRGCASKGHSPDWRRRSESGHRTHPLTGSRGLAHCQGRGKGQRPEMGWGAQRAPAERRTRAGAARAVGDGNPPSPWRGGMVLIHLTKERSQNSPIWPMRGSSKVLFLFVFDWLDCVHFSSITVFQWTHYYLSLLFN